MKYNKLIYVLIVLCVAVTFLGVVSAAEVTIGGEKFNIPDGFVEDAAESGQSMDSTGTTYIKYYKNASDIGFAINVLTTSQGSIEDLPTDLPGYANATIKDIEGICNNDSTVDFMYIHDGKMITISAFDQALLEQILIKP